MHFVTARARRRESAVAAPPTIVHATAPYHVLDIGGWSDTAFAEHGSVLCCAADAYVRVTATAHARPGIAATCSQPERDVLRAIARYFGVDGLAVQVTHDLPPEYGLGALEAAGVAMAAAVARFRGAGAAYPLHQLAAIAHQAQCGLPGMSAGIHGQAAAAGGGTALYRVFPYPRVFPTPLPVSSEHAALLDEQLLVVPTGRYSRANFCGRLTHQRHPGRRQVRQVIWRLRALPALAAEALVRGDLARFGEVLSEEDALRRQLFPVLHSPEARRIRALAVEYGAQAALVNDGGGSVTVLCPAARRAALVADLRQLGYPAFPMRVSARGLQVRLG